MARAAGTSPQFVAEASSRRFICGKTSTDVWCGLRTPEPTGRTLELSFDGLPVLGDAFVYEGWLITADGPVTSDSEARASSVGSSDSRPHAQKLIRSATVLLLFGVCGPRFTIARASPADHRRQGTRVAG